MGVDSEFKVVQVTYRGKVVDGVVVLPKNAKIRDGTVVRVETLKSAKKGRHSSKDAAGLAALSRKLLALAGTVKSLPPDFALNHDHYIHGTPKM